MRRAGSPDKKPFRMTRRRQEALANNPNLTDAELMLICSTAAKAYMTKRGLIGADNKVHIPQNIGSVEVKPTVVAETDNQIEERLNDRFETIDMLTMACVAGDARSLIVSGSPGIGKTFGVEKILSEWDEKAERYKIVSGFVRATGLYKLLYQYRHSGNVIVLDDCDSVFYDDISLNLIKAVCDTSNRRTVSWLSEAILIDEESAERIPHSFDFNGSVIFITNLDFDKMISKGHKLAPHLSALVSRSHYIDCNMKSNKDYIIRIQQVVKYGMLNDLSDFEKEDVMNYIRKNHNNLREISLRMALKIGNIRKTSNNWKKLCDITCLKVS